MKVSDSFDEHDKETAMAKISDAASRCRNLGLVVQSIIVSRRRTPWLRSYPELPKMGSQVNLAGTVAARTGWALKQEAISPLFVLAYTSQMDLWRGFSIGHSFGQPALYREWHSSAVNRR